ncbi:uncharacterized protein [Ptychodera flava]|uniref:uncharacterized protein n=1 Tax=Ptychodera flava TaxID=63121 RepID=UPI00396A4E5E
MDFFVISILVILIISASLQPSAGNAECCENGGKYDFSVRRCDCPESYWGTRCQFRGVCTRICRNGGECSVDAAGRYLCKCQSGYHGDLCELVYNATSSYNSTAISKSCGTPVTATTPSIEVKSSFDMAMMIMYLIIGALVVAFIILTIHYKREYKSIRQQQRQSLRRRLDSIRDSYHLRDNYDVETPPASPRQSAGVVVTTPSSRFKMMAPAMAPPYSESPPPYDTVIISTIIEEEEEEVEEDAT